MNKKESILLILDIFRKYSDENHFLSTGDIIDLVESTSGLRLDRRTVYANIEMLRDYGYEISDYQSEGRGYYLAGRRFEEAEVLMMANAIHANHFISGAESDRLIGKLLNELSTYQQRSYKEKVYRSNPRKRRNKELLRNIALCSKAISDGKQIAFVYLEYNMKKELKPRREKLYIVEPRCIVYDDARPYLVTTSAHHPGFIHYRLDRMSNVRILADKARKLNKEKEPYEYAKDKLFMFSGETITALLRCRKNRLDLIIDRFGTDVRIMEEDEDHFLAWVQSTEQGLLFLGQQNMDFMEILEPESLRNRMKERLEKALEQYK